MVLNLSATKDVVLKCGLRNECYQTCGLIHVTKCVLKVCSFFCGLDFVCALSNMRSSNKKCGLNPALPKTCGLKSVNISATASATNSIFCTTHIHWPADLPLQFDPSPLIVVSTPHQTYPKFRHFSKILLFGRALANPLFLLAQKIPLFQRPRTRRILELQTCKQVFTIYRFRSFL